MKNLIVVVIMGLVLTGASFGVFLTTPNSNETPVVIDVKPGDTITGLTEQWQQDGWLHSAWVTQVIARFFVVNLRPGEYEVPAGLSSAQLLEFLHKAKPKNYKISLIEGRTTAEALATLSSSPYLELDIEPLTMDSVATYLNLSTPLEGWLYPDTYVVRRNEKVSTLITQAYERTREVLQQEWDRRASNLPYNDPYQALIMASIVEKETAVAAERGKIAGVFLNRLNRNMRLETDPTIVYGLGDAYQGNITRAHLRDASNPFNTYRHAGLPPTPIAMAGREAISAVLNPQQTKALFFVAKGDGSHQFSETLEQHNRAVRQYQLNRRSDYRSTPE